MATVPELPLNRAVASPPLDVLAANAVPREPLLAPEVPNRGCPLRFDDLGLRQKDSVIWRLADTFVVLGAGFLNFWVFGIWASATTHTPTNTLRLDLGSLLLLTVTTIWLGEYCGLYDARAFKGSAKQVATIFKVIGVATLTVAVFLLLLRTGTSFLMPLAGTAALNALGFTSWRFIDQLRRERAQVHRHAVIVGTDTAAAELASHLEHNPQCRYRVRGFVSTSAAHTAAINHTPGLRVIGTLRDLREIAWAEFVDEIFITPPYSPDLISLVIREAEYHHINVGIVPDLKGLHPHVTYSGNLPVLAVHQETVPAGALAVKRALDILLSSCALLVLSPLMILTAFIIKLDSEGPVLYRSFRVGKKGRRFVFYKFRTMYEHADELKKELVALNEREGLLFKMQDDPRITRCGRWLRKYSIDELPQLLNVVMGDMSLVGPRPPAVDEYEQYRTEHMRRLAVKPGITGLWQVQARQHPSFDTAVALDLEYINTWHLALDFKLLLKTVPVVLRGTGI
jgi:exopolysaccharide biosynthesis polyprenyl glycosylphosphotransferase